MDDAAKTSSMLREVLMSPQSHDLPSSLILVGAGKMGGSMLEGWLKVGVNPKGVTVVDPRLSDEMTRFCSDKGIALNPASVSPADVLVLAIKPQMLDGGGAGSQRLSSARRRSSSRSSQARPSAT